MKQFIVSVVAVFSVSCAVVPTTQPPNVAADTAALAPQPPAVEPRSGLRHAIYAAHLREMMAELDYLASSRLPEDLEPGPKEDEQFEELAYTAEALAGTAADIPDVLEEVRMSDEDRAYFRKLAGRLRVEALMLQDEVKHREISPAKDVLSQITATCDECHKAFRILPQAMDGAAQ